MLWRRSLKRRSAQANQTSFLNQKKVDKDAPSQAHPNTTHQKGSDEDFLLEPQGGDHDYEEPYFEPASEEEELLQQLNKMSIPFIDEEKELKEFECLGSGAFGVVYRGVWSHSGKHDLEVAVKTMEEGASEEDRVKFLQEAAIMGQFNHPNIISLLGIITMQENRALKIVLELINGGDLRKKLSSIKPNPNEPVPNELAPTLLSYSRQVAGGMTYLAVKCFIHRDLAARNVLVTQDSICKIADFGLSRDLQQESYYISHGGKIPVKWTAPEALHYRKYSTASDVWSYGCVLYEIWSLGCKPFEEITNAKAMKKVQCGFRLPPPPGCPRPIYNIMIKCWHPEPDERPLFFDIMIPLQKPDFQILKWSDNEGEGEALTLGAPLEKGHHLYKDLQRMYLAQGQGASKDEPTESRGRTTERKENGISADPEREEKESGYMVDDLEERGDFVEAEYDGYMVDLNLNSEK